MFFFFVISVIKPSFTNKIKRADEQGFNMFCQGSYRCDSSTYLMLSERQQRRETFTTYRTHVVFGRTTVCLSMLTKPTLREERPGAHVALVVPFDEICLLLS